MSLWTPPTVIDCLEAQGFVDAFRRPVSRSRGLHYPIAGAMYGEDDRPVRRDFEDAWGWLSLYEAGTYWGEPGRVLEWHWQDQDNPQIDCRAMLVRAVTGIRIEDGRMVVDGLMRDPASEGKEPTYIDTSRSFRILHPHSPVQMTLEAWA